uniref:Truncated non-structural protein 3c n=1 Tax=Feline coronavirus TaxID=12663 RepID=A0A2Z6FAD4_9ALPC|nr:truncated non-structural protein 3c [Feline coronavirus]
MIGGLFLNTLSFIVTNQHVIVITHHMLIL